MAFLLASFMAFKQLFDMATSSAFFTFLSQRPRSKQFVRYFWYWVSSQFVVSLFLVALVLPESTLQIVWNGESKSLIVLALVATFMQQHVWGIASQMAEASRQTVRVQTLNTLVILIHLVVVVSLWWFGELTIPLIFAALIVEWSIAGWLAAKMYQQRQNIDSEQVVDTPKSVFKEFWHYCLPFIPYAWLGFAHDFADRWMLQHWGGSSEQAYYAVAQQFAAVALLATTSILRIFWKEIAEAQQPVKPVTYSVVKTGMIGLTRYLATYWAEKNVRCNAMCPGGVENGQPENFLTEVSSRIPMNRLAQSDEYQGTLLWMLSDASSYLNGAVVPVEGGRTAW